MNPGAFCPNPPPQNAMGIRTTQLASSERPKGQHDTRGRSLPRLGKHTKLARELPTGVFSRVDGRGGSVGGDKRRDTVTSNV